MFLLCTKGEGNSISCPEITILNTSKPQLNYVEGVQIPGSTIQLLRGSPKPGPAADEYFDSIFVWDSSSQRILNTFDLNISISKMMYCTFKRKMLVMMANKILEVHPLTFDILVEH